MFDQVREITAVTAPRKEIVHNSHPKIFWEYNSLISVFFVFAVLNGHLTIFLRVSDFKLLILFKNVLPPYCLCRLDAGNIVLFFISRHISPN